MKRKQRTTVGGHGEIAGNFVGNHGKNPFVVLQINR